ncbi:MAG TPA: hypothetical protein VKN76_14430 [Kiloniellaceae bacterium]|nr:hypothetical protein [Kiloniellaceae bacterium]
MAPWIKFTVSLLFAGLGLWAFLRFPFWPGLLAFVALCLIGALLASWLFKRFATADQIKADLEARLHND